MPLTRKSLTHASRIMVPAYPALAAWIAFAYIFGDPARTSTPSFDAARSIMAIRGFGFFFLGVAIVCVIGMIKNFEAVYVLGLACGMGLALMWAGFFVGSIVFTPDASLTAPALWGFVALAHFATFTSLTQDRKDND